MIPLVDGVLGQPGVFRYCATPPTDPADEMTIKWTKEVWLEIDPIKHRLSYEIIENSFGFKSYVALMQLVPVNGEDGSTGCRIEWSFVSDPVEGWKYDDLRAFFWHFYGIDDKEYGERSSIFFWANIELVFMQVRHIVLYYVMFPLLLVELMSTI